MSNGNDRDDLNNRREWLRQMAIGAAGLGAVVSQGCGSNKQPESASPDLDAKVAVKLDTAGNLVQVVCHGMMAFKLPYPTTSSSVIEIHMPAISQGKSDKHVYKAGPLPSASNYNANDLTSGASYALTVTYAGNNSAPSALPTSLKATPIVFLNPAAGAMCKASIPANGQTPFCIISIPIPDDYQGYVYGQNTNPSYPIFMGNDANYCSVAANAGQYLNMLKTTPLVHVFRYTNVAGASLDQTKPSSANHWKANGSDKLQLYAEPAIKMPISDDHLKQLDTYLGLTYQDLDFYNTNLEVQTSPGDSNINPQDLQALYTFGDTSKSSGGLGPRLTGTLADCISVYGS
jgi:hypothetical protein